MNHCKAEHGGQYWGGLYESQGSLTVLTCLLLQVPRVFIGKDCIGGCNDLITMQQNGKLMTRLKQIGALQ